MTLTNYSGSDVIAGLLRGGAKLFGVPVELSWPDGLPAGMNEELLRSIAENYDFREGMPEFVRADAQFCHIVRPCGLVIKDGKCAYHGELPVLGESRSQEH